MKRILLIMLVFIFLLPAGCSEKTDGSVAKPSFFTDYRSIPGVTEQEIEAIEAVKAKRETLIYGSLIGTELYPSADGSPVGFTKEFAELLTELFDIPFQAEMFLEWDELQMQSETFSVDFHGELAPTQERTERFFMSQPVVEHALRIFTPEGSPPIQTESDTNNLRIGFLANTITAEYILEVYPLNFEIVDVENYADAAQKLLSGEIDAFVEDADADPAFDEIGGIKSKKLFPMVYTPISMLTANPELEPFISVINKVLEAGGIDELHDLYTQCEDDYAKHKLLKSYTDEERAYLDDFAERSIGIALENDNYPTNFYNKIDREFQGIAVDILKEISTVTGLKFEAAYPEGTLYKELVSGVRSGEALMVAHLARLENREDQFLWSSVSYTSIQYAYISKIDIPDLTLYQVPRKRVGLVRETAYEQEHYLWFPESSNATLFDSFTEALDALETGEIDLLLASEYVMLGQTNYREKTGYKVNLPLSSSLDYQFGFHKDQEILRSIIDKAMEYIDFDDIVNRWNRRVFDYSKQAANELTVYILSFSAVLLVMLLAVTLLLQRNRKLSKNLGVQVQKRTAELERQTESLKEAEQKAQVASAAKSMFLARMSHEIRTPLNAIIGMSRIIRDHAGDRDKTLSSVKQILISSQHLLSILNDVLDMSKIESGKLELSHMPFTLREMCEDISGIILQRCDEKNIEFFHNTNNLGELPIVGDKLRLNQILINLLGNAVKFTGKGGRVELLLDALREDDKSVTVKFSVCDNGIGMQKEQVDKLFQPFEQADNTIAARFGGTGLGLSISQNLVQMMGGKIEAESEPGVFTCFYFTLTLDKSFQTVREIREKHVIRDLHGRRVLLTEDIDINRMIIRELLTPYGIIVEEAENGQQALKMFEESPPHHYDLIYMDVQMPVMDGYTATKALRALGRPDAKIIPIVAMTANAYKEDVEEALAAGMNGHLSKPVEVEALADNLNHFLSLTPAETE